MKQFISMLVLSLAGVLAMPGVANADQPGAHPGVSALPLTDLRTARWELRKRGGDPEVKMGQKPIAIKEIDACINGDQEGRHRRRQGHRGSPEGRLRAGSIAAARLHDALKLLKNAHRDIKEREQNGYAEGLRDRALRSPECGDHQLRRAGHRERRSEQVVISLRALLRPGLRRRGVRRSEPAERTDRPQRFRPRSNPSGVGMQTLSKATAASS